MHDRVIQKIKAQPTCDVEEAALVLGISRGLAYAQAREGSLAGVPVLRIGSRLRVVTKPLLERLGLAVAQ